MITIEQELFELAKVWEYFIPEQELTIQEIKARCPGVCAKAGFQCEHYVRCLESIPRKYNKN